MLVAGDVRGRLRKKTEILMERAPRVPKDLKLIDGGLCLMGLGKSRIVFLMVRYFPENCVPVECLKKLTYIKTYRQGQIMNGGGDKKV